MNILHIFRKKKSLDELENQRDILLYGLEFMLYYDIIGLNEYNRLFNDIIKYASVKNLKED